MTLLVTGYPGTTATAVVQALRSVDAVPRVAVRRPRAITDADGCDVVRFDFTDPTTFEGAFDGVSSMFLVRPPQLSNIERDIVPALEAAQRHGVRHIVFLSIQGADRNRVVPHHTIETWLRKSSMNWTFVRAAYFMQNLLTQHGEDLREGRIFVPAGRGKTSLVDVQDVAAVAVAALLRPADHAGAAHTVTGPEALTYTECADILTRTWGRAITYPAPGILRYWRAMRQRGMPRPLVAVTVGIYTAARLGMAAATTNTVLDVTGRAPRSFEQFARHAPDPSL